MKSNLKFFSLCLLCCISCSSVSAVVESFHPHPDSSTLQRINKNITVVPNFPPSVHGLTADENGIIYFSDTYSKMDDISRVYTLSPPYTGTPIATEISGQAISGLMWNNGLLYVAFLNKNAVCIYDENLELLETWYIDAPWNFTTSGNYVFVVNHDGNVQVLRGNKPKVILSDLNAPFDIADDGDKSFWISEQKSGKVLRYSYRGKLEETLDFQFKKPKGLLVDAMGNLYIADAEDNKIYVLSLSGNIKLLCDEFEKPLCITKSASGEIIINTEHEGGNLLIIK